MSSVPGIEPNITNNLVSTGGVPGRAIGLVGHRDMADVNVSASARAYDGTSKGTIYNYSSLSDWLDLLGTITTPTWVEGDQNDDDIVSAITPHSEKDSLLYALQLIYDADPSANVYAAILDGDADPIVDNDTTSLPTGASDALDDLLKYDDIGYVVIAGIDPVTQGKTHAETATNSTSPAYNKPRFYVTGIDLFKIWDTSAKEPPLSASDLSDWSGVKSDYGLVLAYVGNHDWNFATIGDDNTRQIGGQLVAAFLASWLASQKESAGVSFSANGLGATKFTVAHGDTTSINYIFSLNELNEAISDGWIITRFSQNSYVFAKGVTFASTTGTSWSLYPHRSITNFLHKQLADNLLQFLGKQQTSANLAAAQKLAEGILGDAVSRQFISSFNVRVKPHPTEVDAIIIEVEFVTVKPINKIYLNITVS